jgi:hypothetical protein
VFHRHAPHRLGSATSEAGRVNRTFIGEAQVPCPTTPTPTGAKIARVLGARHRATPAKNLWREVRELDPCFRPPPQHTQETKPACAGDPGLAIRGTAPIRTPPLERAARVELTSSGWRPEAQPLYHARLLRREQSDTAVSSKEVTVAFATPRLAKPTLHKEREEWGIPRTFGRLAKSPRLAGEPLDADTQPFIASPRNSCIPFRSADVCLKARNSHPNAPKPGAPGTRSQASR